MVKENCLSVFQFLHPMRYYLWHPLEFFGEIWHMMKRAYERATKGYCSWDKANIAEILPLYLINILEDFMKINSCFPVVDFKWENIDKEPESEDSQMLKKWNAEIRSTIQALRDSVNGFPDGYDDIRSYVGWLPNKNGVVLTDEYWKRIAEVNRWRAERFKTAWDWIAENLPFLQLG